MLDTEVGFNIYNDKDEGFTSSCESCLCIYVKDMIESGHGHRHIVLRLHCSQKLLGQLMQ